MVTTAMGTGPIDVTLRLPAWKCNQCILQWTYTAGFVTNEKLGKDIVTIHQGIIGVFALMVLGVLVVDLKKHSDPVQTYQLMEIPLFFQHCHQ